jgi:Alpha-L-arabinofuranosidase B, catalytic
MPQIRNTGERKLTPNGDDALPIQEASGTTRHTHLSDLLSGTNAAISDLGAAVDSLDASLADFIPLSQRGAAGGVATLGNDGKVPGSQLPASLGGGGGVYPWVAVSADHAIGPGERLAVVANNPVVLTLPATPTDLSEVQIAIVEGSQSVKILPNGEKYRGQSVEEMSLIDVNRDGRLLYVNSVRGWTDLNNLISATFANILDNITAIPSAAYSLRRLRSTYTGAAIRVRRSNDNSQQDIGFVGNNLDTQSLINFVGSNSGHIVTWYDQSGNARNATQATANSQPRIVISGAIHTRNNKPAINQNTTQLLSIPSGTIFDGTQNWTVNYVGGMTGAGTKGRILTTPSGQQNWNLGYWTGLQRSVYFNGSGVENSGITADNNIQLYTAIGRQSTTALLFRNGVDFTSQGNAQSNPPRTGTGSILGTNGAMFASNESSDCSIQEMIFWSSQLSQRTILESDQISYYQIA